MIKVTYEELNQGILPGTVSRMVREGRFTPKVAYALMKVSKALDRETENARQIFQKLVQDNCELDAEGKVLAFPEENLAYKPRAEFKDAFDKAQAELLAITFTIEVQPIPVEAIDKGCQLSPQEAMALKPLVLFGDEPLSAL